MQDSNSKKNNLNILTEDHKKNNIESLLIEHEMQIESFRIQANELAHDFNNVLGSIFGYIDLAKNETDDALTSKYLSNALSNMERTRVLTDKLLTFTNRGIPLTKDLANIKEIIVDAKNKIHARPTIAYKFNIENDLWSCEVDKDQLKEALENIIVNSIQAIQDRGVISIKAENTIINQINYIKISISDTGVGMSEEIKERIFEPFYSTKENGQGLGLTTSLAIIKNHNGSIEVESEKDIGSVFNVIIPVSTIGPVKANASYQKSKHFGKGKIIVLVDDPDILFILKTYLESFGYSVIEKFTGEEILDILRSKEENINEIKAIFLTLKILGGLGGNEVITDVKKLAPNIPTFILSGYTKYPEILYPQLYGFTASLKKPYLKKDVINLLNRYLNTE